MGANLDVLQPIVLHSRSIPNGVAGQFHGNRTPKHLQKSDGIATIPVRTLELPAQRAFRSFPLRSVQSHVFEHGAVVRPVAVRVRS